MAKEKLTIEQKLKQRKYKIPNGLVWFLYAALARSPFLGPKYHVNYKIIDDINKCKGPCFVIWNHLSRRDYLFLKNLIAPKRFNMVAGFSEFSRNKFSLLFKLANVIPKKNFTSDPNGVRAMNSIIKQGGTIAFAPEGMSSIYGHNQPIVPGTGRFLQFFRIPVYFMKLEGAYLTSHKTCIDDRIGKVNATLSLLFTPEQLKAMTPDEIDAKINEAFHFDDYEWNKTARVKYKTKGNPCKNLNDLLYKCPKCGQEMCIDTYGRTIKCTHCGNGATIDDYYDVHPFDDTCKIPVSPSAWMDWQRTEVIKEIRKDLNFSYSIKVKVGELPKYKPIKKNDQISIPCGEGVITADHNGIHFVGMKNNQEWKFDLPYNIYYSLVIENETNVFSFYVDGEYYDFIPYEKVVGKMLLIVEEMHRLHVNTWKNFPWCDYMYHGTELGKENDNYEEEMAKLFIQNPSK